MIIVVARGGGGEMGEMDEGDQRYKI